MCVSDPFTEHTLSAQNESLRLLPQPDNHCAFRLHLCGFTYSGAFTQTQLHHMWSFVSGFFFISHNICESIF